MLLWKLKNLFEIDATWRYTGYKPKTETDGIGNIPLIKKLVLIFVPIIEMRHIQVNAIVLGEC